MEKSHYWLKLEVVIYDEYTYVYYYFKNKATHK